MNTEIATRRAQAGLGVLGFVAILVVVAAIAMTAFKVIPMYLDFFTVKSALIGLTEEPGAGSLSPREIRDKVQRRLDVNSVDSVQASDLQIRRDGRNTIVRLHYEMRSNLVGNLDVVTRFDESVTLSR